MLSDRHRPASQRDLRYQHCELLVNQANLPRMGNKCTRELGNHVSDSVGFKTITYGHENTQASNPAPFKGRIHGTSSCADCNCKSIPLFFPIVGVVYAG